MKRFVFAVLALVVFSASAFAQSNTGRLVGSVSDPSGVIPGATLVVTDNQTAREKTVTASDDGSFSVAQLDAGVYTVKISAPGHKTSTVTDVKIDVGREYTLNAVLEVGQISENVTVVGGADVINASTAELSNTVGPRQLVELPLNGRNPLNLVGLQAGTSQNGAQTTHINGQRSTFTNVTRDGLNIQDNFIRGNAVDFVQERPSVDDTGEFTITTQNANADSGYGSSQIQLVTPRGENEFHGAIFEYNRNSKFGANSFFRNRAGTPRPFLNRNQFGGKLAGPVLKNKVFFFFSYEGLQLKTSGSLTKTILLPDARNGIFTYVDNAGVRRQVNLFTTFGAQTGVTSVNPAIQSRFFAATPSVPNTNTVGDALNTSGFTFAQKGDQTRNAYTTRMDYDINDKNTINGVFSYKKEENLRNDATNNFDPQPDVVQPSIPKFLALAWRYSPTPTITNELRGGHFRGGPVFLRTIGLPATYITPTLISTPETTFNDQGRYTIYNNLQDNAEYIRGNHSFRFGGLFQTFNIDSFVNFGVVPTFTIGTNTLSTPFISTAQFTNAALFPGGISTAQRTTANSLLALLGGIVNAGTQTFNVATQGSGFVPAQEERRKYRYDNFSLYLADQWRVRPSLTLNLGVRYEVYTALRETQGLFIEPRVPEGTDPVAAMLDPTGTFQFVGGNAGGDNKLYNTDKNNFAPVVSFAWTPQFKNKLLGSVFGDGRTVIRGGYRMSFVNDDLVVSQQNSVGLNQGLSFAAAALAPNGTTNVNLRANNLPTIPAPPFQALPRAFAAQNTAANGFFATVFGIDPNLQSPRVDEYNFGIQREIGWQTAVEFRYVGSRSNSLVRALDYNQIDIRSNGFLQAFENARFNFETTGNPRCNTPGCRDVSLFNTFGNNPFAFAGFGEQFLAAGVPADFALNLIANATFFPTAQGFFLDNPVAGPVDVVQNTGTLRYNAFQAELRRRFAGGLYMQANYTFQKTLGNSSGGAITDNNDQTRFEPNLDNLNPGLEYSRLNYDQTHVFNFNSIYELPFGKGKRWMNSGEWTNRIFGGFQLTSILRVSTGAPLNFTDARGTLNRAARAGRQTPQTNLTKDQIKNLIGIFDTPCGIFYINPSVVDINLQTCAGTGRAARGFGVAPFAGQVFFNNNPGQSGGLERNFINGPMYLNWDAGFIKNIQLTERVRFQIRGEAFNVLNRANLAVSSTQQQSLFNINSANFGRLTTGFSPRVVQFAGRLEF